VQPVLIQQPVGQPVLQPVVPAPAPAAVEQHRHDPNLPQQVFLISHSTLLYWWPIWVVGYAMAFITWMWGDHVHIGNTEFMMHPSKNLGVIFTLTFFLVILITNVNVRGTSSVVVIMAAIIATLALAYFQLWDSVLEAFGRLAIYMNLGFYVFFASVVFLVWAFTFFIYDRLSFWRIRPGQITHETIIGYSERSHDTRGTVFEKHQSDLFRHWILGLGSGDITISTTGAKAETISIPNVLFVNNKLDIVQRMIAAKPTTEKEAG
jgi:hypothetical protein